MLWLLCVVSSLAFAQHQACDLAYLDALANLPVRARVIAERFWAPTHELTKHLENKKTIDEVIDSMVAQDARQHVFRIESLFRIYEEVPGQTFIMKRWRARAKYLEDHLGAYVDSRAQLKEVRGLKDVPQEIVNNLEQKQVAALEKLKAILKDDEWVIQDAKGAFISPQLMRIKAMAKRFDWPKQKKDRRYILDNLISEIEKIESAKLDMAILEKGLHKKRRMLRWILIEIASLRGRVEVEDVSAKSTKELLALIKANPVDKKYLTFDVSDGVKKPIQLPMLYFEALGSVVTGFGKIKDEGMFVETLTNAFLDSGLAKSHAEAEAKAHLLALANDRPVEFIAKAKQFDQQFMDSELLEKMRKFLKDQI